MFPTRVATHLNPVCHVGRRAKMEGHSMASRDWHSIASTEILLMAAGGGLLAWCNPKFGLLAIVAVVALGRFRGRIQALIAASTLSAVGIAAAAAGHPIPHGFMGPFSSVPRSAQPGFVPLWLTPSGCTICTMRAAEDSSVDDRDLNLRQVIDSAPALIHTARPDVYLDFFNRTWLDFVGQPLKSLLGWKWTSWIHSEDVESFVQKWRESIATGERFEGAARVRRADGEYRWMLHHKLPLRARDGGILKWHGSSIDIEGRTRAEEELRKSARELQRSEFYLAEAQRL